MLVKPLRITKETYIDRWGDKEEVRVAVFDSATVGKIQRAYEKYEGRKGVVYKTLQEVSNRLYPSTDDFLEYCLGEPDDGYICINFEGIKGTNKNVTRRLYDLFKKFEWVDHLNQRAFSVVDCGEFFIFGHDSW